MWIQLTLHINLSKTAVFKILEPEVKVYSREEN